MGRRSGPLPAPLLQLRLRDLGGAGWLAHELVIGRRDGHHTRPWRPRLVFPVTTPLAISLLCESWCDPRRLVSYSSAEHSAVPTVVRTAPVRSCVRLPVSTSFPALGRASRAHGCLCVGPRASPKLTARSPQLLQSSPRGEEVPVTPRDPRNVGINVQAACRSR